MGGVAAALAACRGGHKVCLTEEMPWLGGQATAQGVSALDEHDHIESFGATASYYSWRESIRAYYRDRWPLSEAAEAADFFNPGDGWVSRCCFEPRVGVITLLELLREHVASGRLQLHYGVVATEVEGGSGHVSRVRLQQADEVGELLIEAAYVLDATELGDLLPLTGTAWRTGAESVEQTGEPHARTDGPAPHLVQTWTIPFIVERDAPGTDHTIPRPAGYEANRDQQPFTLTMTYGTRDLTYKVFEPVDELPGAFWTYRRVLAASQFAPGHVVGDLAMINWAGNDYKGGDPGSGDLRSGDLISAAPERRRQLIEEAKQLSLGLLYWLQTEVPRDDGQGTGYPELRLRREAMGTADGLAMFPYVRESRRIVARTTVREQDVSAAFQSGARAEFFSDSVGVGWYPIDIHGVPGDVAVTGPTRPFQIPLGALIPKDGPDNLLAACKNIGTTHMTNGCYRLHPIEWNIGEAAGALAGYCVDEGVTPATVHSTPGHLAAYQRRLIDAGMPLTWFTDVPIGHPAFEAVQQLAAAGVVQGREGDLLFRPDEAVDDELREQLSAIGVVAGAGEDVVGSSTRGEAVMAAARRISP